METETFFSRRRLKQLLNSLLDNVLVTLAIALAAGWVTGAKLWLAEAGIPMPAAIGGGLIVSCAVVTGWTAIRIMHDRGIRRRLANPTTKQMESQIRDWAWQFGLTVSREPDDEPDLDFQICVRSPDKTVVYVEKKKDRTWLTYVGKISFNQELKDLLKPVKHNFSTKVRLELLRSGVEYIMRDEILVAYNAPFPKSIDGRDFLNDLAMVRRAQKVVQVVAHDCISRPLGGDSVGPPLIEGES